MINRSRIRSYDKHSRNLEIQQRQQRHKKQINADGKHIFEKSITNPVGNKWQQRQFHNSERP